MNTLLLAKIRVFLASSFTVVESAKNTLFFAEFKRLRSGVMLSECADKVWVWAVFFDAVVCGSPVYDAAMPKMQQPVR